MAEINLLKNELREGAGAKRFLPSGLASFYIVLAVLILVVLVYLGMLFYGGQIKKNILDVEQRSAQADLEISKTDAERKTAIGNQKQIQNLQLLLKNHVFWTPVLRELEEFTYSGALFSSMQFDGEAGNKFIIEGKSPSYTELGKLIEGLKTSEQITDVVLQATSRSDEETTGVNFNIEVFFDTKLFNEE